MTKYITTEYYKHLGYKWHKAKTNLERINFDPRKDPGKLIRWCNDHCEGRWSGHLNEMLFESMEDKVKFVLQWG